MNLSDNNVIYYSPLGHRSFLHAHNPRAHHRRDRGLLHEEAGPPRQPREGSTPEVVTTEAIHNAV